MPQHNITTRPAIERDAPELANILNAIIDVGGTTAYQRPLSNEEFADKFLRGPRFQSCVVAEDGKGDAAGLQALETHPKLPAGWADIATFARLSPKLAGVGTALFVETVELARRKNLVAINATIRADNTGGLAFYDKMGFETYKIDEAIPLSDGTPVDRISKRFFLT